MRFPRTGPQENVHPNTYSAHPVACAAALANIRIMEKENLVSNAEAMGTRLREGLEQAVGQRRIVGEVRGRGLLVCADLVQPDGSGAPLDSERVATLDRKAWDPGRHRLRPWLRGPAGPAALHHEPGGRSAR